MNYIAVFANKATFLKGAKGVKLVHQNSDEDITSTSDYRQPFLPGVGRNYTPRSRNGKIMIDLSQAELNKLVMEMELYDKKSNQITSAPISNPGAPFWTHPKVSIFLENSGTTFDDEDVFGKFWLAVLRADRDFNVDNKEIDNPALDGVTKFNVTRSIDALNAKDKDIDEVSEATKLLHNMDFEKRRKILRAMGIDSKDPSPEQLERHLMEKIVTSKDKMTSGGERNIELFLRLARTKSEEINIRGIITKAISLDKRVILKQKGMYYYGEVALGRTVDSVYDFLIKEENADLLADIALKVDNGNT